jgi:hypothetical protein
VFVWWVGALVRGPSIGRSVTVGQAGLTTPFRFPPPPFPKPPPRLTLLGPKRPTPTQSTCLYYDHDNEASKCARTDSDAAEAAAAQGRWGRRRKAACIWGRCRSRHRR